MKKYNKILGIFGKVVEQLAELEETNNIKAGNLTAKSDQVLGKAQAKSDTLISSAADLYEEGAAAVKTMKKIKDLLF